MGRFGLPAKGYRGQPSHLVRAFPWTYPSDGERPSPGYDIVGLALGSVGVLGRRWQVFFHAERNYIAAGRLVPLSSAAHRREAALSGSGQCVRARFNGTIPAGSDCSCRRDGVPGGQPLRLDDSGGGAPYPV